jgi:hypothetical protein
MIETEEQRRWWFATHPEFSWSRTGGQDRSRKAEKEAADKVRPEEVDAYVDNALKHVDGPVAVLLESVKRNFGTEGEPSEPPDQTALESREEVDYREGWYEGYWAIHKNKVPPDVGSDDKSAYARGVREGTASALDEREAWRQKWLDPLLMLAGTHPSQILATNLTKAGQPRPSADHDAHHLVPERHWRALRARDALENWGIPISGEENGMWLDRAFHRTLSNNYEYMDNVTRLLKEATSRREALKVLEGIRNSLSRRMIPR